jgi:transposase-like protein
MQLSELLEKADADDIVREMIGFVAQRLMGLDVVNRCGAAHGERSEERTNSRNGYRERSWDTRAGTEALRIPKLRTGSYFPPFLEPRRIDVVGIFPNELSICNLVGALLIEQNDQRVLKRRYMTLETLAEVGDSSNVSLPAVAAQHAFLPNRMRLPADRLC